MKNSKGHPFLKSFLYAGRGIALCIRQRNMRFHISCAVWVTAFSLVYRLTAMEYGLLFFAIGLVLALEAVNTALEHLTDLVSPGYHPLAGMAKDAAAGAVLIGALTAVAVGFALFFHLPKLTDVLLLIVTSWRLAVFGALTAAGALFTFAYPQNRRKEPPSKGTS